jgi:transposase
MSIVYGGLDVHKQSISAYLINAETGEVISEEVMNDRAKLVRAVRRWAKLGELRLCYEASSAGYVLKRWVDDLGLRPKEHGEQAVSCEVIAPSLIPKAAGDRVKTDKRDAKRLALLYKAGLLQPVRVPSPEEETVRALVRLMTSLTGDLTRSKNRLTKYLRSLGLVYYEKTTWSEKHRAWIASLTLGEVERLIVQTHLDSLDALESQRNELEKRVTEIAATEAYWPKVQALLSLRGIGVYSAMVLLTEIGDARRFGSPTQLMSYLGLVPSESSSGDKERRGRITKAGNSHARWILAEAAWNQRFKPGTSRRLKKHWPTQPKAVVEIAKKAERRLHQKYWKLALRKAAPIAATAVAREMAGFVWALLTLAPSPDKAREVA